ncbi:MAG TPA: hypothetical protein DCZ73_05410 [Bacteroides sp.]|nr:hypothetical protein [Bacteroides sp.]
MKKIRYFILMALCALGVTACQDDLMNKSIGVDTDKPVKVDLKFGIPKSMQVEVTRADNSLSDISALRLYIFNSNGSMLGTPQDVSVNDIRTDDYGHHYTASVTLYAGTQTVYAVANAATRNYWENPVTALDAAALQGKTAFLDTMYDLVNELTDNNYLPGLSSDVIPLTGEGVVTVGEGNSPSVSGDVRLQRPVAKILFDITEEYTDPSTGHKITFAPQYYGVYKVAGRGHVMAGESNRSSVEDSYFYNTRNDQPITDLTNEGIYVPENIQIGTECEKYDDREAFDALQGNTDATKVWTKAPKNATYIVIRGNYTETDEDDNLYRSAAVSYTIHLGDWNSEQGYNDFSVLRNYIYTYKMTVQGVDKIVVEAEAEEDSDDFQNGAEGDVIELGEGSEVFNLDAHYEQVYVSYNLSDIANQIRSVEGYESRADELIANAFMLTIHSPMNRVGATEELLKPYNGEDEDGADAMYDFDSDWIEFYSQENDGLSTYTSTNGNNNTYLLNAWEACRKMGQAVRQLVDSPNTRPNVTDLRISEEGGSYYARFTIFVGENFYTHDLDGNPVDWADFTRIDPRTLLIATDMQISPDGNSSYAMARTYISQASILTFYNRDSADDTNALGIELYNEYGKINGFSSGNIQHGNDPSNGRENMLANISYAQWNNGNHEKVNFNRIGYTRANVNNHIWPGITSDDRENSAYIACLSRNRDLDRNGRIDDDEVYWYLPARSQYLRIGIGSNSLGDYQLYTGDKSLMKGGDEYYPSKYVDDGSLYYSNTSTGNDAWELYWAVEVGAYGSNSYGGSAQIRCVRNLPSRQHVADNDDPNGDDALAGPVHGGVKKLNSGNYIFDFDNRLDGSLYRATTQEGPYSSHNEMSTTNRLPGAFVVAERYVGEWRGSSWVNESFTVREGWSTSERNNPCADYYETNADRGLWRVPNLSELTVMSTVADEIELLKNQNNTERATLCSTRFSNANVRIGFRYNGSMISAWSPGAEDKSTGYVRCVRDATAAEIAEVRGTN